MDSTGLPPSEGKSDFELPKEGKSALPTKEGKSEVWKPGGEEDDEVLMPGSAAGAIELITCNFKVTRGSKVNSASEISYWQTSEQTCDSLGLMPYLAVWALLATICLIPVWVGCPACC